MADSKAKMRFFIRYTVSDPSGYFHTRWDNATPIEVIAKDREEAEQKVSAVIGAPPRNRAWTIKVDKIVEEIAND